MNASFSPLTPSLPAELQYDQSRLNLFPEFSDRRDYKARTGEEAPTFNPSKREKRWRDATHAGSDEKITYNVLSFEGGIVAQSVITMTGKEADEVNFFGVRTYPPFVMAPSAVMMGTTIVPPEFLADVKTANEVAWGIGAPDQVTVHENGNPDSLIGVGYTYPPGETRRVCEIAFRGQMKNAGRLILLMNVNGVGAPGHFNISSDEPQWVDDRPQFQQPTTKPLPVPQRPLDSSESTIVTGAGMGFLVVRAGAPVIGTGTGGSFTAEHARQLQAIYDAVGKK